jgi:thiamine kinase-like enzyme
VIRQLPRRFLLERLQLRDLPDSHAGVGSVLRSRNNLVVKKRPEVSKEIQETLATQLARLLLPQDLSPPPSWGCFDGYYVSEFLPYEKLNPASPEQARLAACYLASLHSVPVDSELRHTLSSRGYCHYYGPSLKNRLRDELKFARKAFGESDNASLRQALDDLADLLNRIFGMLTTQENPVLGHGDFQASNLLVSEERVWPLDWADFGLCSRAYEVMHFVHSLSLSSVREEAIEEYECRSGIERSSFESHGDAIDAVIRAGSKARHALLPGTDNQHLAMAFMEHVHRGKQSVDPV